jgi:hypothetical protein
VIALDTNILLASRRRELAHHVAARRLLAKLARGRDPWAIPWPCVYEFLSVVTHRRVFSPPTPLARAVEDIVALLAAPALVMLGEGPAHAAHLERAVLAGQAAGNLAFDAHIAALCVEHGVSELWTLDRDFARFPGLKVKNPFGSR